MNSAKKGASHLTAILKKKDVKHVVICPGSRNAPLILSLTSDSFFNCYSIVDERSAGFFALGLAQSQKHTVAVVCTSGSALLNLAPAAAEAYYQRLPLLIISADRPKEWVNMGESQTMIQNDILKNFTRANFDLVQEPESETDLWFHDRQISEAIDHTLIPYFGPVHINIRFREPLYNKTDLTPELKSQLQSLPIHSSLEESTIKILQNTWDKKKNVMIICGQMFPNESLRLKLESLAKKGVVVLTESISNLPSDLFFPCIDKIIIPANEAEKNNLKADLVITIGGPLVSRKIKNFFRDLTSVEHWHVDALDPYIDSLQHQRLAIKLEPSEFLNTLINFNAKDSTFYNHWLTHRNRVESRHLEFISGIPFSDMKAYDLVLNNLPQYAQFHVGNSAAIRYVQLFNLKRELICFSNRGTSGIEGSVSTAVGFSHLNEGLTFLLIGDLSAFYDSNGFWNNYLNPKLKVVVVNNGGGGIFHIIEGPKTVSKFEEFIETKHNRTFEKIADLYDLAYFSAKDEIEFNESWTNFLLEDKRAALLEIRTSGLDNEKILMNYFDHLKN